jgi:hypothetical protein
MAYRASTASDDCVKGQRLRNTVGHAAAAGLDGLMNRSPFGFARGSTSGVGTGSLWAAVGE